MFESMIGDPRVLYYALLDKPDAFEEGLSDVVQKLVAGTKKFDSLTREELAMLDRAVFDFVEDKRPRAPKEEGVKPDERSILARHFDEEEDEEEEGEAGGLSLHIETPDVPTFWWRKS